MSGVVIDRRPCESNYFRRPRHPAASIIVRCHPAAALYVPPQSSALSVHVGPSTTIDRRPYIHRGGVAHRRARLPAPRESSRACVGGLCGVCGVCVRGTNDHGLRVRASSLSRVARCRVRDSVAGSGRLGRIRSGCSRMLSRASILQRRCFRSAVPCSFRPRRDHRRSNSGVGCDGCVARHAIVHALLDQR